MKNTRPKPAVSPLQEAGKLDELWSPRVIAELDDNYVKVARLRGTLAWHSHDDEDEMFYILKGQLRMEYEHEAVELVEGDLHVVPRGVLHNPVAQNECLVLLIERKSTLHTGRVSTEKTRNITEQLRGYQPKTGE
jgi:mannose-6-phosphate isomerase-like protein (cupin superfamily)